MNASRDGVPSCVVVDGEPANRGGPAPWTNGRTREHLEGRPDTRALHQTPAS